MRRGEKERDLSRRDRPMIEPILPAALAARDDPAITSTPPPSSAPNARRRG